VLLQGTVGSSSKLGMSMQCSHHHDHHVFSSLGVVSPVAKVNRVVGIESDGLVVKLNRFNRLSRRHLFVSYADTGRRRSKGKGIRSRRELIWQATGGQGWIVGQTEGLELFSLLQFCIGDVGWFGQSSRRGGAATELAKEPLLGQVVPLSVFC